MIHIYGIKNCSTVKKSLNWLDQHKIDYSFHDFKKEGAPLSTLEAWQQKVDWTVLVNKKGTTWKKLSPEQQAAVVDAATANQVLTVHTSIIKRPVVVQDDLILLGFNEEEYQKLLK